MLLTLIKKEYLSEGMPFNFLKNKFFSLSFFHKLFIVQYGCDLSLQLLIFDAFSVV